MVRFNALSTAEIHRALVVRCVIPCSRRQRVAVAFVMSPILHRSTIGVQGLLAAVLHQAGLNKMVLFETAMGLGT